MTIQSGVIARRAMTVREFREAYRLSHTTVYDLIRTGALPNVKIGGKRIIPVDAAEALLKPKGAQ